MGKIYEALEWQRKDAQAKRPENAMAPPRMFSIARFNPQKLKIRSAVAPHYEELKANFLNRYAGSGVKTVMFAGVEGQDGASSSAVYFAGLLARDRQHRVMLLDANLRRPGFQRFFNIANCYSLRNLAAANPVAQFLPPTIDAGNLYVIPSGGDAATTSPSGFVQSANFRQFIGDMRDKFDFTVIDAPALRDHAESVHLGSLVDGVVLVVSAGTTPHWVVANTKKRVEDAGGNVLGVVLNKRRHYIPGWLYRML